MTAAALDPAVEQPADGPAAPDRDPRALVAVLRAPDVGRIPVRQSTALSSWQHAGAAPEWHTESPPCAGADPDAWHTRSPYPPRYVTETCRGCPFRRDCLADALAWGPEFGVWGGYTARQVRRMRTLLGVAPPTRAFPRTTCTHEDPGDRYWSEKGQRWRCRGCNRARNNLRDMRDADAAPQARPSSGCGHGDELRSRNAEGRSRCRGCEREYDRRRRAAGRGAS